MEHHHASDPLAPEQMQLFMAGLASLSPDEVRKAKVLYIRNAISEYRSAEESVRAFGCVHAMFAIIPFFWPVLYLQKRTIRAGMQLKRDRIRNAMEVWKDDLRGERFDLEMLQ